MRLILDACVAAAPASVLELGCGIGVFRAELLRRLPDVRYWGCDVSQSAVDQVSDPNVVRADLNVDGVPFPGLRVDCVVASGILEYLRDVPGALGNIRERLAPGGRFLVSHFNFRHIYRPFRELWGRDAYRHPTWVNDHSPAAFRRLLRDAGFEIRDICPNSLGLGGSPSIGNERWSPRSLRMLRRLPGVRLFAHQLIYECVYPA